MIKSFCGLFQSSLDKEKRRLNESLKELEDFHAKVEENYAELQSESKECMSTGASTYLFNKKLSAAKEPEVVSLLDKEKVLDAAISVVVSAVDEKDKAAMEDRKIEEGVSRYSASDYDALRAQIYRARSQLELDSIHRDFMQMNTLLLRVQEAINEQWDLVGSEYARIGHEDEIVIRGLEHRSAMLSASLKT